MLDLLVRSGGRLSPRKLCAHVLPHVLDLLVQSGGHLLPRKLCTHVLPHVLDLLVQSGRLSPRKLCAPILPHVLDLLMQSGGCLSPRKLCAPILPHVLDLLVQSGGRLSPQKLCALVLSHVLDLLVQSGGLLSPRKLCTPVLPHCDSAIKTRDSFPICCAHEGYGSLILLSDLRSSLSSEKLEELFCASLGAFVASSGGTFRFCPSSDCPLVYRVTDLGMDGKPFVCGVCYVETCSQCHMEYHPFVLCGKYKEFKKDSDSTLKEWCKGKEHAKDCPVCRYTIKKMDGCNHIECSFGRHVCWIYLKFFAISDDCYDHLRSKHETII
ncbi:RNA helicase [Sarracenia purpurea var. burkii]